MPFEERRKSNRHSEVISDMENAETAPNFKIRAATENDVPLILSLIRELAEYERLSHEMKATEEDLHKQLFEDRPVAQVLIGEYEGAPIGFALFYYTFSTFLGKPGIYLEDLYIKSDYRRRGFGHKFLAQAARLAKDRNCGRLEWAVLRWNQPAIRAYQKIDAVPLSEWRLYRLSGDALDSLAAEAGSRIIFSKTR
jgi:GNAT superfamily N-acetyltransferase